jgi:hypothetical protein
MIWMVGVFAGLCGGWLAAGSLNNQRIDVPRAVAPTTLPSSPASR